MLVRAGWRTLHGLSPPKPQRRTPTPDAPPPNSSCLLQRSSSPGRHNKHWAFSPFSSLGVYLSPLLSHFNNVHILHLQSPSIIMSLYTKKKNSLKCSVQAVMYFYVNKASKTIHLMGTPVQAQFTHACNPSNLSPWPEVMPCHHKCLALLSTQPCWHPRSPQKLGLTLAAALWPPPLWHRDSFCPISSSYIVSGTVWPGADTAVHSNPDSGSVNIVWCDTEWTLRAPEM